MINTGAWQEGVAWSASAWLWLALLGYGVAAVLAWRLTRLALAQGRVGHEAVLPEGLTNGFAATGWAVLRLPAATLALLAHALLWYGQVFDEAGLRFGFAHALSMGGWMIAALTVLEAWHKPGFVLQVFAYPLALLSMLLPLAFPGHWVGALAQDPWFRGHFVLSLAAFSAMTLSLCHALLMAMLDRQLHRHLPWRSSVWSAWLDQLPPLVVLERLLFHTITVGFVLLTGSLITGFLFMDAWYHRLLRWDHKTVFALLSWCLFSALLCGRWWFGWRGRRALRWVFAGFMALLLAYVGSRFVLEVVLHRHGVG